MEHFFCQNRSAEIAATPLLSDHSAIGLKQVVRAACDVQGLAH
jgi:hypothetical protein